MTPEDFVKNHCTGKQYDSCKNSPCLYASHSGCTHPLHPKHSVQHPRPETETLKLAGEQYGTAQRRCRYQISAIGRTPPLRFKRSLGGGELKTKRRQKMPLFEVAILEKPTKKEMEEGAVEKLVFGPKPVVANDEQSAGISAVLDGGKVEVDKSRMLVLVRPFV